MAKGAVDKEPLYLMIRTMFGPEQDVVLDPQENDSFVIGRKVGGPNGAKIKVSDKHVSRRHCVIEWDKAEGWVISDLDTTNGTILNGDLLTETLPIPSGAEILLGTTRIIATLGTPDHDATRLLAPGEDKTSVLVAEEDETVIAVKPLPAGQELDETTQDEDATLITDANEDATMIIPEGAAQMIPDDEATMIQSDEATMVPDDEATMIQSDEATILSDEEAPAPVNRKKTKKQSKDKKKASEATTINAETGVANGDVKPASEQAIARAALSGIAFDLVSASLIDENRCQQLIDKTRDSGVTFFRTMADDGEVRFKSEIFGLVAEKHALTLIENEKTLEQELVHADWLPVAVSERKGILALQQRSSDVFRYATLDPFDVFLGDWVERNAGMETEKVLVVPDAFNSAINRLKNQVSEDEASEIGIAINITTDQERWIRTNIVNIDVPQLVNYFIHRGYVLGASDIHVEPMEDTLALRNRVDGILHEDTNLPLEVHPEIISRVKILSGMDVAEKRRPQDGRIGLVIRGMPIDVRVSSFPTVYGEKIVMRLLDKSALRPSPETLGLLANGLRLLKDKINAPYGLIMISGPTGSGKTTTLYSCLGSIDKAAKNVLTVEDPVEYRLRGVHQMQVNEKIGLTFASGLRTILRQDPDVIMIGECRDTETAAMAIQASLTGHIVFSTIHTNDAIGVITRLLDMNIDSFLVANALSLTVAQRLVRRVCKHCRTTISGDVVIDRLMKEGVSQERLVALGIDVDPDLSYVAGSGCMHCNNTGYLGRQAVFEVFEMTSEVRAMIMSDDFSSDALRQRAIEGGMITLVQHGLHFVDEGVTTHEEVLRVLGEGV